MARRLLFPTIVVVALLLFVTASAANGWQVQPRFASAPASYQAVSVARLQAGISLRAGHNLLKLPLAVVASKEKFEDLLKRTDGLDYALSPFIDPNDPAQFDAPRYYLTKRSSLWPQRQSLARTNRVISPYVDIVLKRSGQLRFQPEEQPFGLLKYHFLQDWNYVPLHPNFRFTSLTTFFGEKAKLVLEVRDSTGTPLASDGRIPTDGLWVKAKKAFTLKAAIPPTPTTPPTQQPVLTFQQLVDQARFPEMNGAPVQIPITGIALGSTPGAALPAATGASVPWLKPALESSLATDKGTFATAASIALPASSGPWRRERVTIYDSDWDACVADPNDKNVLKCPQIVVAEYWDNYLQYAAGDRAFTTTIAFTPALRAAVNPSARTVPSLIGKTLRFPGQDHLIANALVDPSSKKLKLDLWTWNDRVTLKAGETIVLNPRNPLNPFYRIYPAGQSYDPLNGYPSLTVAYVRTQDGKPVADLTYHTMYINDNCRQVESKPGIFETVCDPFPAVSQETFTALPEGVTLDSRFHAALADLGGSMGTVLSINPATKEVTLLLGFRTLTLEDALGDAAFGTVQVNGVTVPNAQARFTGSLAATELSLSSLEYAGLAPAEAKVSSFAFDTRAAPYSLLSTDLWAVSLPDEGAGSAALTIGYTS